MKALLVLSYLLTLIATSTGQSAVGSNPLKLSFELRGKSVCAGTSVGYSVTLTNISTKPIAIDSNQLDNATFFERFVDGRIDSAWSVAFGSFPPTHYRPNFKVLEPRKSLMKLGTFELEDPAELKPGKYLMNVGYQQILQESFNRMEVWSGTVVSNRKHLEILSCNRSEK